VTPIRAIPSDFDPSAVAAIERRLRLIEAEHKVRIVWAVESGSRAWGFPSPDSDYDCRFIFVRPLANYLSVEQRRNVIEVPIEEGLAINGWDLFKMARLLLKGNAVAIEWLTSPIIYRGLVAFRDEWCREADRFVDRAALVRHYYHLGHGQFRRHMAQADAVSLKKVFYVLWPCGGCACIPAAMSRRCTFRPFWPRRTCRRPPARRSHRSSSARPSPGRWDKVPFRNRSRISFTWNMSRRRGFWSLPTVPRSETAWPTSTA